MSAAVIVWFRQDLRVADNPALSAAAATGAPVVPLYILEEDPDDRWAPGGASRWWLHHSLAQLGGRLAGLGAPLVLRRGRPREVLERLAEETGARTVFWNRRYEPAATARDGAVKAALKGRGLLVESFDAALLFEPWTVRSKGGTPFRVFSPFWRACLALPAPAPPTPAPTRLAPPGRSVASEALDDWGLRPVRPDWAAEFASTWTPGEEGAARRLAEFLDAAVTRYRDDRNHPGVEGTSRLSPHLRFGDIGPRGVWSAARAAAHARPEVAAGAEAMLREIGWREFSHHLLFHNPDLPEQPLNGRFAAFPWRADPDALTAWRRGRTGYPIVDAGMRQLWRTGWMHNRVRMIVASFLVKDLMQPWQAGQAWFWDTLVDADLANNAAGWQWVAGCGADAAPYVRVFNPILQGEKFDPDGDYVRAFLPELARLPARFIHRPWEAPALVLREAGVRLGETYPERIVDHALARDRALKAYERVRAAA